MTAGEGVVLVDLARTTHFEVEDEVVWARAGGRLSSSWTNLGEVEAAFPGAGLLRIHRHLLVRPEAVLGLRPSLGGADLRAPPRRRGAGGQPGRRPPASERLGL